MGNEVYGFSGSCFFDISIYWFMGTEVKLAVIFLIICMILFYFNKKTKKSFEK